MINLVEVKTKRDKHAYIDFIYKVYKTDTKYRDLNLIFVKNWVYDKIP
jgi:hypothetical protein